MSKFEFRFDDSYVILNDEKIMLLQGQHIKKSSQIKELFETISLTKERKAFFSLEPSAEISRFGEPTVIIKDINNEGMNKTARSFKSSYSRSATGIHEMNISNSSIRFGLVLAGSNTILNTFGFEFGDRQVEYPISIIEFLNKALNYFMYDQNEVVQAILEQSLETSREFIKKFNDIGKRNKYLLSDLNIESNIKTKQHEVLKKVIMKHGDDREFEFYAPYLMELKAGDKAFVDTCYGIFEAEFVRESDDFESTPTRVVISK